MWRQTARVNKLQIRDESQAEWLKGLKGGTRLAWDSRRHSLSPICYHVCGNEANQTLTSCWKSNPRNRLHLHLPHPPSPIPHLQANEHVEILISQPKSNQRHLPANLQLQQATKVGRNSSDCHSHWRRRKVALEYMQPVTGWLILVANGEEELPIPHLYKSHWIKRIVKASPKKGWPTSPARHY